MLERSFVAVRALCGTAFAAVALLFVPCCKAASLIDGKGARHSVEIKCTEASNGKEVSLKLGQTFTLTLTENPSTGYVWKFATSGNIEQNGSPACLILSDSFVPKAGQSSSHVGSPGIHEWRFRADLPGTSTIELRLIRPWDASSVKRSFLIHLRVT